MKRGRATNKRQVTSNVAETTPLITDTLRGARKCDSQVSVMGITTPSCLLHTELYVTS